MPFTFLLPFIVARLTPLQPVNPSSCFFTSFKFCFQWQLSRPPSILSPFFLRIDPVTFANVNPTPEVKMYIPFSPCFFILSLLPITFPFNYWYPDLQTAGFYFPRVAALSLLVFVKPFFKNFFFPRSVFGAWRSLSIRSAFFVCSELSLCSERDPSRSPSRIGSVFISLIRAPGPCVTHSRIQNPRCPVIPSVKPDSARDFWRGASLSALAV